jgi:hypothetical protein
MGKVMQPLQSVNCLDSRAHSHERHGPFTRLVGVCLEWLWLGLSWSSRFGLWYAAGVKLVCMVLSLATCGMPVSIGQFSYRCDSCELVALGYCWVT